MAIKVTAFIHNIHAAKVGAWGVKHAYKPGVEVVETFNVATHEEALDKMARLIVPLGATIANMKTVAVAA